MKEPQAGENFFGLLCMMGHMILHSDAHGTFTCGFNGWLRGIQRLLQVSQLQRSCLESLVRAIVVVAVLQNRFTTTR